MAEATCRRELELEIPAEEVTKQTEKVAKDLARVARIPGFRPGKAPLALIKRRFAEDIKGEVLQTLVPERVEKAVAEEKLTPVSQPQVDKLEYKEGQPVKFRASFEVLPEFSLGDYKNLEIELPEMAITDESVANTLAEMQQRAATFVPVEGRTVQNGDFVQVKLLGTPEGGGEPLKADSVLCEVGAEETMAPFNEHLLGTSAGDHKNFDVAYPADYPDAKLAGKTLHYSLDVLGIKTKQLPELNDEFAKDFDATSLDELNKKVRENLEHQLEHDKKSQLRNKVLAELVKSHDFPVPESLVENQKDVLLRQIVRSLAERGVDPRAIDIDWSALRQRQEERARDDVKAELVVDRIATEEKIEVNDDDLHKELEHLASHSGESAEVLEARLTKQGALDRMKAKLRSDKTVDWLAQTAKVKTVAAASATSVK